jgi:hypothetical protein
VADRTIEPKMGATYGASFEGEVAVYEYDQYPSHSVLAGRTRRVFLDSGTLEEMRAKFPEAREIQGSRFVPDNFADLSDREGDDDYDDCSGDWKY